MEVMLNIAMIVFGIICVLMIFIIMIQPGQGDGLAGAFGGTGSDSFFGTRAGQHMNRFTIGVTTSFLVMALLITILAKSTTTKQKPLSTAEQLQQEADAKKKLEEEMKKLKLPEGEDKAPDIEVTPEESKAPETPAKSDETQKPEESSQEADPTKPTTPEETKKAEEEK